jgi:hypothetical protein
MQYSFCFAMKMLQTVGARPGSCLRHGALLRTRGLVGCCTSSGASRAIHRIPRIRDHPLAAHDHGNSFSGSRARHWSIARRNPRISACAGSHCVEDIFSRFISWLFEGSYTRSISWRSRRPPPPDLLSHIAARNFLLSPPPPLFPLPPLFSSSPPLSSPPH